MDLGLANGIYSNKLEGYSNGIFNNINTGLHNGIYNESLLPNNIVKRGLILYLDAKYPKSYPRTGNIWNDLSINNNKLTLIGTPTYNSDFGGHFSFQTNQYITSSSFNKASLGNNFTISIWFYSTSASTTGIFSIADILNSSFPFIILQKDTTTTTKWYINGGFNLTNTNISNDVWYNITLTYDLTTWRSYVNGKADSTYTGALGTFSGNNLYLGNAYPTYFIGGKIAMFNVYNRPLSQSEINQNYIATKTRFNL